MHFSLLFGFILYSNFAFSALPVYEIGREKDKIYDALIIAEEAANLGEELGESVQIAEEINQVRAEIDNMNQIISYYKKTGRDIDSITSFNMSKYNRLSTKLRYMTEHIRKFKRLFAIGRKLAGSTEAVTVTELMETNRNLRRGIRDDISSNIEKDKQAIYKLKARLIKEEKERLFWKKQYEYINNHSSKSGFGKYVSHSPNNSTLNESKREVIKTKMSFFECKKWFSESWCSND